jgi:hypothetical protein
MASIDSSGHEYPTPHVVRHLDKMLDRLFTLHQQLKKAKTKRAADAAYEKRWLLLNQLEEFLGDACTDLAP